MKIYTKTGDKGDTGLFGAGRVLKSSVRIQAIGAVDELNAGIGMLASELASLDSSIIYVHDPEENENVHSCLQDFQSKLFDVGAALADGRQKPDPLSIGQSISKIESIIDLWQTELPELKEFILPGGTKPAANAFWVRAICRSAERSCVAFLEILQNSQNQNPESSSENPNDVQMIFSEEAFAIHLNNAALCVQFLNRMSDFLFVLGRILNFQLGMDEPKWQKQNLKSDGKSS